MPKWSVSDTASMAVSNDGHWYVNDQGSGLMLLDVGVESPAHWRGTYEELREWFEDPTQSAYCYNAHGYVTLLLKMRSV